MLDRQKIAHSPAPVRLIIFILSLLSIWLPVAAPIYLLVKDSNLVSILTMGLLFGEFLLLLRWWGQKVYRKPNLLKSYGLVVNRCNGLELLIGLGMGVLLTFSLFGLQGLLGWVAWQNSNSLLKAIAEGLAVGLGVGFAEELVFRGWLLDELQRDYNLKFALWADAAIFALLHFIKPLPAIIKTWPQFPGLLLLGLTLVFAKRSHQNRLGLSIGFHAGLVGSYYIINVGQLIKYSDLVPDWLTGVNRNPLAGLMGIFFLSIVALGMKKYSTLKKLEKSSITL